MATLTVRMTDEKHNRLKALAKRRNISVNKLVDEWATLALTEFDSETRFRVLAAAGDSERGLDILDQLDAHFERGGA